MYALHTHSTLVISVSSRLNKEFALILCSVGLTNGMDSLYETSE